MLYSRVLRPILFGLNPETAHHAALRLLSQPGFGAVIGTAEAPRDPLQLWNLTFRNRLGLAAGFDKNAIALRAWKALGFGFVEIGTATRHPQPGNPRPRLFRCRRERGLVNRLGFPNDGADVIAARLRQYRQRFPDDGFVIGANIGKSRVTTIEDAATDYLYSFRQLYDLADFFVVNVSSPNTPGLRDLQSPDRLKPILELLQHENRAAKPLLVKIAPDLSSQDIRAIVALARDVELSGIVATNTTIDHSSIELTESGGLSGKPLTMRSTEVVRMIRDECHGALTIVGVGGVFTAADYQEKRQAGAELVELYTGLIYEGPKIVTRILTGASTT